jgi:hypothetical protein
VKLFASRLSDFVFLLFLFLVQNSAFSRYANKVKAKIEIIIVRGVTHFLFFGFLFRSTAKLSVRLNRFEFGVKIIFDDFVQIIFRRR